MTVIHETSSFDAHTHEAVVSIDHALKSNPAFGTTDWPSAIVSARTSVVARGRRGLISAVIAAWPRTPRCHIPLHGALHDGRIMNTHTRAYCSSLEAHRVEIIISPPFVVNAPRDLRCRWWNPALRAEARDRLLCYVRSLALVGVRTEWKPISGLKYTRSGRTS